MKKKDIKKLVVLALCIALSYMGSLIKISGSIALDALPAFFAAIFLGPFLGGLVGFMGHLFTSFVSGFPLTIPIHLVVALMMFFSCSLFGIVYKKINPIIGIALGIMMNGPISLALAALVFDKLIAKGAGYGMFMGMVLILTLAATINVMLAAFVYEATKKYIHV
jgi:uncharacterized membrane protein